MAVTTDPYTAANLAPRIPEVWTPIVQEQLFAKTVAMNWFTNLTEFMGEGDIANIADIYTNAPTASTQSTQGAEITTTSEAQVNVQLTVDTHSYIAFIIGDKDARQLMRSFDFTQRYAKKAAGILKDGVEDAIFALWSGLSTNSVGDTATVLTDLEIRQSIEKLDTLNFELEDIGWFFHPYVYWNQVAGVQKYYDASMRGNTSITVTGNFGPMSDGFRAMRGVLYDLPVFVTPNVVSGLQTYRNLLAHRDALGWANQTPMPGGGAPNMGVGTNCRVQAEYELRNLGTLAVVDILYGVAELRDQAAVVVNANSSATTS